MSAAFNKRITVQASVNTTDGKGMVTRSWDAPTIISSNVPASIQEMSSRQVQDFQRLGQDVNFEILTKGNSNALQGHRIPDPDVEGVYYIVVSNEDMAGRGRFYSIKAKRTR